MYIYIYMYVCIYIYIYIYIYIVTCDVYSYCLRSFLTACRKEIVFCLPLAARRPNLIFPYCLAALTV